MTSYPVCAILPPGVGGESAFTGRRSAAPGTCTGCSCSSFWEGRDEKCPIRDPGTSGKEVIVDARSLLFGRYSTTCPQCGGSGIGGRLNGFNPGTGGEYACSRCHGIGSIGNCPDCAGTGIRGRTHGIGGSGEGAYTCSRCRGLGAIGNCPDCGGTGISGKSHSIGQTGGGEHICPRCYGKGFVLC